MPDGAVANFPILNTPSTPDGALVVVNCPNLKTPSIIRFPVLVCESGPSFIGAGRLELN